MDVEYEAVSAMKDVKLVELSCGFAKLYPPYGNIAPFPGVVKLYSETEKMIEIPWGDILNIAKAMRDDES